MRQILQTAGHEEHDRDHVLASPEASRAGLRALDLRAIPSLGPLDRPGLSNIARMPSMRLRMIRFSFTNGSSLPRRAQAFHYRSSCSPSSRVGPLEKIHRSSSIFSQSSQVSRFIHDRLSILSEWASLGSSLFLGRRYRVFLSRIVQIFCSTRRTTSAASLASFAIHTNLVT